jgi:ABC-type multidrug transport system ATPase subunit
MTAILGSSGAGKTSLLNILAKRIESNKEVTLTGDLLVNLRPYTMTQFATFASYVLQNDVLFETLTPREALTFVANLKFSGEEEKERRVNETISALKL